MNNVELAKFVLDLMERTVHLNGQALDMTLAVEMAKLSDDNRERLRTLMLNSDPPTLRIIAKGSL